MNNSVFTISDSISDGGLGAHRRKRAKKCKFGVNKRTGKCLCRKRPRKRR